MSRILATEIYKLSGLIARYYTNLMWVTAGREAFLAPLGMEDNYNVQEGLGLCERSLKCTFFVLQVTGQLLLKKY